MSQHDFWGFDTETDNNVEGGQAVLLNIHGPRGEAKEILFPRTWEEIWDFMKGRTYVAFNADFDIQAICHDTFLPYKLLRGLGRFKRMEFKRWRFKYVPTKFLTVSDGKDEFTVYDLQQFYGLSLASAAQKYLPDEAGKDDIPRSWYPRMAEILRGDDWRRDKVLRYARQDARLAYNLCRNLVTSFTSVGVIPRKLISPASLTIEYFGGQLKEEPPVTNETNALWINSFFGGRVEVGTMGTVRNVSLYDIHSAYPYEIAKLRSLKNAELIEGHGTPLPSSEVVYGLYRVTAYVPLSWVWGPLAVRDGNKVIYPVGAVTTWCGIEGRRVLEEFGVHYDVHEYHEFICKGEKIFKGIEGLYASRKNPVLSLAAKLMLNSLYGKLCEARRERISFGSDAYRSYRVYGRFTNYILASHITESVRMRVFRVLHAFGKRAHFAATDSVMIEGELMTGPGLGEWDLKGHYKEATILGCGRYFLTKPDGSKEVYLRGFAQPGAHVEKILKCKRRGVKLPMLQAQSLIQWANDGAASDLNVLCKVKKELRCDDDKRFWFARFKALRDAFNERLNSSPWILGNGKALNTLERIENLTDYGRS